MAAKSATRNLTARIARRPFHRLIGYANCWEDPTVLQRALQVGPGDVCLSITSGGCNTLSLLLHDPARVVALDFNPNQNHLLRLKMAALGQLDHGQKLELLGVRQTAPGKRIELYTRVRNALTPDARMFWDDHLGMLEHGVLYEGRLERYLKVFGKLIGGMLGPRRVEAIFDIPSLEAQRAYYFKHIDGLRWRSLFDVFFSRTVITRAKDKHHFKYVDFDGFGRRFRARAQHIFADLSLPANYFMALILLGRFHSERALPPYLLEENHDLLRGRLERLELVTGDLEGYLGRVPDDTFTRFNLSNLFDWFAQPALVKAHREIVRVARIGARLCWWNTLAVRHLPGEVGEIVPENDLARDLLAQDRFIYAQLQIGQIKK
ncbi:MAG: DUF3419 family protein [Candidatus Sericytochromatia bacterium]|uniref:DUF3419 family protein n=1 Tax=Candidatus Tanganyikabacteria bacterium TaxID=2961651 RepID=A0A937X6H7_9BACT|nr:DUF3419 family protein [Candidatus Tanganyikabacteria bacterium]